MSKIFPFDVESKTYRNYSVYLNEIYNKAAGWESSYNFFNPEYKILNETLNTINAINLNEDTVSPDVSQPAWKCTITTTEEVNNETVEVVYATEFCFFPSELGFRESYLNTYYRAWLCYFAPPNAYTDDPSWNNREFTMTLDEWNEHISKNRIQQFKPSRLIISKTYAHKGVNFSGNPELFDSSKYLIISKPSAAWYFPTFFEGGVQFDYVKNALEEGGSMVPLTFEFSSSRYILAERESEDLDDALWGAGNSRWGRLTSGRHWNAGIWASPGDTNPSIINLYTFDKQLWTNSYPIMHKLQLRLNSNSKNTPTNTETKYWCEDFITDDVFSSKKYNSQSHSTARYSIITKHNEEEVSEMWDSIFIVVC